MYEDGTVIYEGYAALQQTVSYTSNCNCYPYGIAALQINNDDNNKHLCYVSYYSSYLGTINNLPNMIQKKSTQTMKITYTLTDAE